MSELSIELAESARSDLAAMVSWYETQGVPEVGERFVAEILARVETRLTGVERALYADPDPPAAPRPH